MQDSKSRRRRIALQYHSINATGGGTLNRENIPRLPAKDAKGQFREIKQRFAKQRIRNKVTLLTKKFDRGT
jgi:hypothetical protein